MNERSESGIRPGGRPHRACEVGMSQARMTVNLCPYCGEEDLRPDETDEAGWTCRACLRRFTVAYRGMVRR